MEYTQNYALRKPGLNEYANVGDLNFNADRIDSQMKKNQDVDGEVYDPTTTSSNAYEAGDYVINPDDGLMYVCNGTTYGTWDATKWDHTTEFEEIQKAMASGGESNLADLHDVEIATPTDGQALLYDDQNDEWVNSDLPDADVTKTASGNPIEITDGADAPLVKCVTEIQGSQDLHGYDKPWVGGAGKNKLPLVLADIKSANTSGTWSGNNYTVNGVTLNVLTDNDGNVTGIKANGTPTNQINLIIPASNISDGMILNGCPAGGSQSTYYMVSGTIDSRSATDTGNGATIAGATDRVIIRIEINYAPSNLMFYPMIRLSTVTDSTFEPYSNICPITAYSTGNINVVGKNLIDAATVWSASVASDGSIDYPSGNTKYYIPQGLVGRELTFSAYAKAHASNSNCRVAVSIDGTVSNGNLINNTTTHELTKITFTPTSTSDYVVLANSGSNGNYIKIQLELGSTATDYEPYKGVTHTTTYPSAIYRGSEDCVKGEVTSEWIYTTFGALNWNKFIGEGYNNLFYSDTLNSVIAHADQTKIYTVSSDYESIVHEYYEIMQNGQMRVRVADGRIYVFDERFTDATEFSAAVANVQLAYQLATPTTSSVTPTNLPIKSLSGYNHIESSTGEMEIEYFPAKEQPLIDLIQSSQHVYSTQEQVVGKWVDGKDVYEKTYVFNSLPSVNDWTAFDEDCGIDTFVDYSLMYTRSNGQIDNDSDVLRVAYNPPNSLGDICYYPGGVGTTHITVRYTKTSSNNRSLAKSAPQEEQVEELKEELTEEVKEEVKEEPEEETKEETVDPETNEEEKR